MTRRLFFRSSIAAFDQITHTFAFHEPCVVAMWSLRTRVESYLAANPEASHEEIVHEFVVGSGIRSADLRRACVEATWESQQAEFAGLLLVTLLAHFESFIKNVTKELRIDDRALEKQLLYPTTRLRGTPYGIGAAISRITATRSDMLTAAYYPLMVLHRKNSRTALDALMLCYRYFKECRNCLIHNGRSATAALERAFRVFLRDSHVGCARVQAAVAKPW